MENTNEMNDKEEKMKVKTNLYQHCNCPLL